MDGRAADIAESNSIITNSVLYGHFDKNMMVGLYLFSGE